jgi:hypothetical protein
MVSQPEHSRALSLRGPSSVVSRSSRHRRQGRSHAGGSSYIPQNEFPVFSHTGDVEIIITARGKENRYLLHRLILTQCSGFFEASTSHEWSKAVDGAGGELSRIGEDSTGEAGRPGSSRDMKRRWRYELDSGADGDDIPLLVQKDAKSSLFGANHSAQPPPVRNKPPPSSNVFFRSVANLSLAPVPSPLHLSQADEELLRDYDNLFRIFYNYAPSLDAINIADAYIQCKTLLSLADMYDALAVVGPRVDHHLLQFQSRLWKQVAKYPPSYLKLGYLARSKVIYSEALIHVVGQWPVGERHLRNTLPENVLEVIEDKVDELEELVGQVECKLFRLCLFTSRGERVTPSNNYSDWLAMSLFRQWLAENTTPTPAPKPPSRERRSSNGGSGPTSHQLHAPPTGNQPALSHLGRVFHLIGGPNPSSYLNRDECKRFLKLMPENYSRDGLRRFERRLEELKAMARELVKPLMRCGLQLESGEAVGYLTCSRVHEADFVWDAND